jgi:hypothetical protein
MKSPRSSKLLDEVHHRGEADAPHHPHDATRSTQPYCYGGENVGLKVR